MPTLKYYKALSKLMTACGIADFSLQVSRAAVGRLQALNRADDAAG